MKVVRHARFGPPADVLHLAEEDIGAPGPDEVVIAIEATPIHAGDLKNIEGEPIMVRHVEPGEDLVVSLPQVPGIEGVGRVVAVGSSVTEVSEGQRVFLPIQCGSWRERIRVKAAEIYPAPEGDPIQLALLVNALTAELALTDIVPLQSGDWILQNCANSNVGRALIPLARRRGIRTINVVRRREAIAELERLGGDVVLEDGPDLAARVAKATKGQSITLALDGVAGDATGRLAECLSDSGTLANYGLMSGQPCKIPSWILLYRNIVLRGYYMGFSRRRRSHEQQCALFEDLGNLIVDGTISAKIAATYPLNAFREAVLHAARSGQDRNGRVVLEPPRHRA